MSQVHQAHIRSRDLKIESRNTSRQTVTFIWAKCNIEKGNSLLQQTVLHIALKVSHVPFEVSDLL
jgi:hypothetical protein